MVRRFLTLTLAGASALVVWSLLPTGSEVFASGTLNAGTTTFSTSVLTAGSHSITAVYGGNDNIAASTSAVLTQTVK